MEKRIFRSRKDQFIGGVISGAVTYFGLSIDPNIIRILYVLFTVLINGGGILLYLIAWFIIPKEPIE